MNTTLAVSLVCAAIAAYACAVTWILYREARRVRAGAQLLLDQAEAMLDETLQLLGGDLWL